MRYLLLIISIIIGFTLNLFSQGNYVFEKDVFDFIYKIETAKRHRIKTINYYPDYKDSLNKGECKKMELYDSTGILIKEVYYPNSKKEYFKNTFEYDNSGRLKIIYNYLTSDDTPFSIIHLDYYYSSQLKSIVKIIVKSNHIPDTLLYYYTPEGRFDYKLRSFNRSLKIYIRYNKCNKIEYIESMPFKEGTIQLDSNDCIVFVRMETIESDMEYHKRVNNDNCQNVSDYGVYKSGPKWSIYFTINEYDTSQRLLRTIDKKSQANTMAKCENKLEVSSVHEFEYNDRGLQIFHKIKNGKGKLTKIIFTEYKYW